MTLLPLRLMLLLKERQVTGQGGAGQAGDQGRNSWDLDILQDSAVDEFPHHKIYEIYV